MSKEKFTMRKKSPTFINKESFAFYVRITIDYMKDYIGDELLDKEWKTYSETTTLRARLEEFKDETINYILENCED